jgi:hypothetical protein
LVLRKAVESKTLTAIGQSIISAIKNVRTWAGDAERAGSRIKAQHKDADDCSPVGDGTDNVCKCAWKSEEYSGVEKHLLAISSLSCAGEQ